MVSQRRDGSASAGLWSIVYSSDGKECGDCAARDDISESYKEIQHDCVKE